MEHRIQLPNYSKPEEAISSISHALGAALSVSACVLCIIRSAHDINHVGAAGIVSAAIYVATMIILYTMSSVYHALPKNNAKRVFRVIDHCSVFLLIAGTYTPFTLVSLRGALGWTLFGIIWGLTIIGIVFNAINLEKYRKVSLAVNLVMGWLVVFSFKPLYAAIGGLGARLLIAGGITYSIGAVLYGIGHKVKYTHSIFHFFVLGGSIFHFFAIYLTIL